MRRKRHFENSCGGHTGRRALRAEQLEKRELLAADFSCAGVPIGAAGNAGVCQVDSALVGDMLRAGGALRGRGAGRVGPQSGGPVGASEVTVRGALTPEEALGVTQLREEEKLARDVYLAFAEMSPIFSKIARAEIRHMDAVGRLIAKYELADPVVDDTPGVFTEESGFTQLYNQLVETGSGSLIEAYKVGAMIEEMDISDLQDVSSNVANSDVARVYENLLRGSRNHLRTFAAQIEDAAEAGDSDATYEAQFLTQIEFDAIANSPLERGNGRGGQGQRGGAADRGQTGEVGEPIRPRDRFGDVETGRQTRSGNRDRDVDGNRNHDGDRQLDRDRDCISQENQASQQTTARDRLFADLGVQRKFRGS